MTDWLKELDVLPVYLEKTKVSTHVTDKTDNTKKLIIDDLIEHTEERIEITENDSDSRMIEVKNQLVNTQLKSFYFKCTDGEGRLLSNCQTIDEARDVLEHQFGKKLIAVDQYH